MQSNEFLKINILRNFAIKFIIMIKTPKTTHLIQSLETNDKQLEIDD